MPPTHGTQQKPGQKKPLRTQNLSGDTQAEGTATASREELPRSNPRVQEVASVATSGVTVRTESVNEDAVEPLLAATLEEPVSRSAQTRVKGKTGKPVELPAHILLAMQTDLTTARSVGKTVSYANLARKYQVRPKNLSSFIDPMGTLTLRGENLLAGKDITFVDMTTKLLRAMLTDVATKGFKGVKGYTGLGSKYQVHPQSIALCFDKTGTLTPSGTALLEGVRVKRKELTTSLLREILADVAHKTVRGAGGYAGLVRKYLVSKSNLTMCIDTNGTPTLHGDELLAGTDVQDKKMPADILLKIRAEIIDKGFAEAGGYTELGRKYKVNHYTLSHYIDTNGALTPKGTALLEGVGVEYKDVTIGILRNILADVAENTFRKAGGYAGLGRKYQLNPETLAAYIDRSGAVTPLGTLLLEGAPVEYKEMTDGILRDIEVDILINGFAGAGGYTGLGRKYQLHSNTLPDYIDTTGTPTRNGAALLEGKRIKYNKVTGELLLNVQSAGPAGIQRKGGIKGVARLHEIAPATLITHITPKAITTPRGDRRILDRKNFKPLSAKVTAEVRALSDEEVQLAGGVVGLAQRYGVNPVILNVYVKPSLRLAHPEGTLGDEAATAGTQGEATHTSHSSGMDLLALAIQQAQLELTSPTATPQVSGRSPAHPGFSPSPSPGTAEASAFAMGPQDVTATGDRPFSYCDWLNAPLPETALPAPQNAALESVAQAAPDDAADWRPPSTVDMSAITLSFLEPSLLPPRGAIEPLPALSPERNAPHSGRPPMARPGRKRRAPAPTAAPPLKQARPAPPGAGPRVYEYDKQGLGWVHAKQELLQALGHDMATSQARAEVERQRLTTGSRRLLFAMDEGGTTIGMLGYSLQDERVSIDSLALVPGKEEALDRLLDTLSWAARLRSETADEAALKCAEKVLPRLPQWPPGKQLHVFSDDGVELLAVYTEHGEIVETEPNPELGVAITRNFDHGYGASDQQTLSFWVVLPRGKDTLFNAVARSLQRPTLAPGIDDSSRQREIAARGRPWQEAVVRYLEEHPELQFFTSSRAHPYTKALLARKGIGPI